MWMGKTCFGLIGSGLALVAFGMFAAAGCDPDGDSLPDDVARCGDGVCHPCEGSAADEDCEVDEVSPCEEDCSYCGDGSCSSAEELSNCEDCWGGCCDFDADQCYCGDGCCELFEDCLEDCGYECGDGVCNVDEDTFDCIDCSCGDGFCDRFLEDADVCPEDCDPCSGSCGNGICDAECETPETCRDCSSTCDHGPCEEGTALESSCDPCVEQVCGVDETCCVRVWDGRCVAAAMTLCPEQCS